MKYGHMRPAIIAKLRQDGWSTNAFRRTVARDAFEHAMHLGDLAGQPVLADLRARLRQVWHDAEVRKLEPYFSDAVGRRDSSLSLADVVCDEVYSALCEAWELVHVDPGFVPAAYRFGYHPENRKVRLVETMHIEVTSPITDDRRERMAHFWNDLDCTEHWHFQPWHMDFLGHVTPVFPDGLAVTTALYEKYTPEPGLAVPA